MEVADLDRDGYLDIIISNGNELQTSEAGQPLPGSFIYWGSAAGWPVTERSELPIVLTRACAVADMNNDGHLDLVFGQQGKWGEALIFQGKGNRDFSEKIYFKGSSGAGTPGVADLNKDGLLDVAFAHDKNVLIYYQLKDGSFSEQPLKIATMAKTMCVADVNGDDWLDLVCPVYKKEGSRSLNSYVLLGGAKGFNLSNSIQLATDGGTGSIVSDFNNDGFQDIFFFCHRADGSYDEIGKFGDHNTQSVIYWGSAQGFNEDNNLRIASVGVHYDVGIDIGDIKSRSFVYSYTSSPYNSKGLVAKSLSWQADLPPKTKLKLQLRVADTKEALEKSKWTGPTDTNSFYLESAAEIKNLKSAQWIQYRVLFDSYNGANAPILKKVQIQFE